MRRVVILDEETPARQALLAQLRQTGRADAVLASDATDVVSRIEEDHCAAILVDRTLVGAELPRVLAAVRSASWRPLVLIATEGPTDDLDPDLISLVVRKPYEVGMVIGILLAAVSDTLQPPPGASDVANPGS